MAKPIIINSCKLYPHQRDLALLCCNDVYDHKIITCCSSRQKGKTLTASNILLWYICNIHNGTSIYVSPTYKLSSLMFDNLRKMTRDSDLFVYNGSSFKIVCKHTNSEILFISAQSEVRGLTCKKGIMIVDEAAYIPDDFFDIIMPFTNVFKTKTLLISTPFTKSGFFYNCFESGLNNIAGYESISFNNYDTSMLLSDEQKEHYRSLFTPNRFKTEILGEFLDSEGLVFTNFRSCINNDVKYTGKMTVGIDWATVGEDSTVVCIMNANRQVVYIKEAPKVSPVEQIKWIVNELKNIGLGNFLKIRVEKNSIGAVYSDLLKKNLRGINIEEFVTTNDSKANIVEQLQVAFQNNEITIPENGTLLQQLSQYGSVVNSNRKVVYNAINNGHDDYVIALCLANKKDNLGTYCFGFI